MMLREHQHCPPGQGEIACDFASLVKKIAFALDS
jgi:hypothetical protein